MFLSLLLVFYVAMTNTPTGSCHCLCYQYTDIGIPEFYNPKMRPVSPLIRATLLDVSNKMIGNPNYFSLTSSPGNAIFH